MVDRALEFLGEGDFAAFDEGDLPAQIGAVRVVLFLASTEKSNLVRLVRRFADLELVAERMVFPVVVEAAGCRDDVVVNRSDRKGIALDAGGTHGAVVELPEGVVGSSRFGKVEPVVARGDDGEYAHLFSLLEGEVRAVGVPLDAVCRSEREVDDVGLEFDGILDGGDQVGVGGVGVCAVREDLQREDLGVWGDALEPAFLAVRGVGGDDSGDVHAVLTRRSIPEFIVFVGVVVALGDLLRELAVRIDRVDFRIDAIVDAHVFVGGIHTRVDDGNDHPGAVNTVVLESRGDLLHFARLVFGALILALATHGVDRRFSLELRHVGRGHRCRETIDEEAELTVDLDAVGFAPRVDEANLFAQVSGFAVFGGRARLVLEGHEDGDPVFAGVGLDVRRVLRGLVAVRLCGHGRGCERERRERCDACCGGALEYWDSHPTPLR